MERTNYTISHDSCMTLEILYKIEELMSKEELNEMNRKTNEILGSLFYVKDIRTRALMEKMFKYGYLSVHLNII